MKASKPIFDLTAVNKDNFQAKALEVFQYQVSNNPVYKEYVERIGCDIVTVNSLEKIPFLPIAFYKSHTIITENQKPVATFYSSRTTGAKASKHFVADVDVYIKSFTKGFKHFFGKIEDYSILALLPSYLEQKDSSLVFMVHDLIKQTKNENSGFYLHNYDALISKLISLDLKGEKILLIGVSYALLDLIEKQKLYLKNTLIMETGGMKGRRKEMVKSELHELLKQGYGVSTIYSEYGMTELLSQAYSLGEGLYQTPPWMKILIREIEDPFALVPKGESGGINIIDLANINSCSFIATQDLGKIHIDEKFEILGRFDHADIRGCNLMLSF